MSDLITRKLNSWVSAGVIDQPTADRIRAYESAPRTTGLRWPAVLAIAFGAIMIAAGVLLFIAAHWENLSPTQRFVLVLAMTAGFHLCAGALMPRMRVLGMALHAVGTVSLGGGIFLAAQIFNLQENWPGGVLLWAVGAFIAWAILRDWLQAMLVAILIPAWITSEWAVRTEHFRASETPMLQFLLLLAITYLSAYREASDSAFRRGLTWIGGLALLPLAATLAVEAPRSWPTRPAMYFSIRALSLLFAFGLPLFAAGFLRGRKSVWNLGFGIWIYILALFDRQETLGQLAIYGWCALGAIVLVYWGIHEGRRERIDLGVAGFAITIIVFYFSTVMDKLGRSASLLGFGLLFLLGGWKLEQLRRKLVARTAGGVR